MKIRTDKIRLDGGTQPRAQLSAETIAEYMHAMEEGTVFPPITVFNDGKEYWLADGFHRVGAARMANIIEIDADIKQGTQREAVLFSVGVNSAHGLRRTNEDKRRAVLRLLEDPEWGKWSDREIARKCNVGHPLVASLRPDVTGRTSSEKTYTTKHGTTSTMNTENIGRTAWTNPEPPKPGTANQAPPRKPIETPPRVEKPEVHEEYTTLNDASAIVKMMVENWEVFIQGESVTVQHQAANELLKYFRDISIRLNQTIGAIK